MNKNTSKTKKSSKKLTKLGLFKAFCQRHKIKIIIIGVLLILPILAWKVFWLSQDVCMFLDDKRQAEEIVALMQHPLASEAIPGVARKSIEIKRGNHLCFHMVTGFSINPRPRLDLRFVSDSGQSLIEVRESVIEYLLQNGFMKSGEDSVWGISLHAEKTNPDQHFKVFITALGDNSESVDVSLREVRE